MSYEWSDAAALAKEEGVCQSGIWSLVVWLFEEEDGAGDGSVEGGRMAEGRGRCKARTRTELLAAWAHLVPQSQPMIICGETEKKMFFAYILTWVPRRSYLSMR